MKVFRFGFGFGIGFFFCQSNYSKIRKPDMKYEKSRFSISTQEMFSRLLCGVRSALSGMDLRDFLRGRVRQQSPFHYSPKILTLGC